MAPKTGVQNLMAQTRQLAQANLEVRAVLRRGGSARGCVSIPLRGERALRAAQDTHTRARAKAYANPTEVWAPEGWFARAMHNLGESEGVRVKYAR